MASKKILILSHKPPYPKIDGGSIAIAQVLEVLLEQGHHVTFLCMETDKHPANSITRTNLSFKVIYVNTKLKIASAISNLFSKPRHQRTHNQISKWIRCCARRGKPYSSRGLHKKRRKTGGVKKTTGTLRL